MLRLDLILFRPFRFWLEELIGFAFGFAMVFFLCKNRHSAEQLLWLPNTKYCIQKIFFGRFGSPKIIVLL